MLVAAIASTTVSCKKEIIGSGPSLTVTRPAQHFNAIDLQMNGNVFYTVSDSTSVRIIAKESIHHILQTQVVNGVLLIRYNDGKTYDADESIRIELTGPGVNSLSSNTSGSIYVYGEVKTPRLSIRSSGSGNIVLDRVNTYAVDAEVAVSGDISVNSGVTTEVTLKSMASGSIKFAKLDAKTVTAEMKGSGDITIKVSDQLDATIKGSGSLFFYGSPSVQSHVSGSGRLVHL
jgi:hypothetical protein